jgi:hypothetical protein
MDASQIKQLAELEQEIKDMTYQIGELQDFKYFLTSDFIKSCDGKVGKFSKRYF